jgi:hypothetical protein
VTDAGFNETVMTVALGALAVYFTVMVVLAFWRWVSFRRVRHTALYTWHARVPLVQRLLPLLGMASAAAAILNGALGRPLHHVYSQFIMAVYFVAMVPLLERIPIGVYRDGVLADRGFVPWGQIARLAFRESPEIVLLLLRRGRGRLPFRLPVPASEYGAVRTVLLEKMRERRVDIDAPLLGLGSDPGV